MNENNQQAKQDDPIQLKKSQLPAYCPTEAMGLWNSHPRVYIPLEEEQSASCPYCGTKFELIEEA